MVLGVRGLADHPSLVVDSVDREGGPARLYRQEIVKTAWIAAFPHYRGFLEAIGTVGQAQDGPALVDGECFCVVTGKAAQFMGIPPRIPEERAQPTREASRVT